MSDPSKILDFRFGSSLFDEIEGLIGDWEDLDFNRLEFRESKFSYWTWLLVVNPSLNRSTDRSKFFYCSSFLSALNCNFCFSISFMSLNWEQKALWFVVRSAPGFLLLVESPLWSKDQLGLVNYALKDCIDFASLLSELFPDRAEFSKLSFLVLFGLLS